MPRSRLTSHTKNEKKITWATRGWCRLERLAVHLGTRNSSYTIEVQGGQHSNLTVPFEFLQEPVGQGKFTIPADRDKVAAVVQTMVKNKMQLYLRRGDLHNYRLLLNLQNVHFRGFPLDPIDDFVPGFGNSETDPSTFFLDKFMYQNGFNTVVERDEAGWTPLCYAAINGNPMLISSLLERRADVNDRISKASRQQIPMPANSSILLLCVNLGHNDAIKLLLASRANINFKDATGSTAMHYACANHSVETARTLHEAGASVTVKNNLSFSALMLAGGVGNGSGSAEIIQGLLTSLSPGRRVLNLALHSCILLGGASAEVVSSLIESDADVDCQLNFPSLSQMRALMAYMSLRHRWRKTAVSLYAYHHSGATPLMSSILCGAFESAAVLITAGARLELRNSRGKTAADLAAETSAPDFILSGLRGQPQECELLVMSHFRTFSEAL